jgi:serine/threonine protein phosphatase 1
MDPAEPQASSSAAQRTYAIGDLHGRLDLLQSAAKAIANHAGDTRFRVVFLGDYVDRGPDSRGVVNFLMGLQKLWPVVCLKGNHEELMIQAVNDPGSGALARWLANGGDATLRSYDVDPEADLAEQLPRAHLRWLLSLPRTTGDQHRIYVHAGLLPGTPVHRQSERTCLWIRERFLQAGPGDFEAHIVHGHTPIWEGKPDPAEPELLEHRTNLDTGAFATGVLVVAVFDGDTPGGPVELIRIKGKAYGELRPEEPEEMEERRGGWAQRWGRALRGRTRGAGP